MQYIHYILTTLYAFLITAACSSTVTLTPLAVAFTASNVLLFVVALIPAAIAAWFTVVAASFLLVAVLAIIAITVGFLFARGD